jgi:hypothetical protein
LSDRHVAPLAGVEPAIYHLRVKVHPRRSGVSAPARAAYRSGGVLIDKETGEAHDFTPKRGIEWTGILAPENAPPWVYDRQKLWNVVEASETRVNSRLAREVEITLPRELTPEQCKALVHAFVRKEFVSKGMVVNVAIHRPDASDGKKQPHAHVLLTTRGRRAGRLQ